MLDSLGMLLNNDEAALSCNSGESFPTENLLAGMLCFRKDTKTLHQLLDDMVTWRQIADLSADLSEQLGLKANLASPTLSGAPTAPTATAGTNTTQIANAAFVRGEIDAAIAALINNSPAALDTLAELSAALGGDANFATTMTLALSNKLDKSGGTVTGNLAIQRISGAAAAIELGNIDGRASSPLIDFHSGATAIDYDARISASGGTGSLGGGTLSYEADTHQFAGKINHSGQFSSTDKSVAFTTDGLTGAIRTLGGIGAAGGACFGGAVGIGVGAIANAALNTYSSIAANLTSYGIRSSLDVKNAKMTGARTAYGAQVTVGNSVTYENSGALGFSSVIVGTQVNALGAGDSYSNRWVSEIHGIRVSARNNCLPENGQQQPPIELLQGVYSHADVSSIGSSVNNLRAGFFRASLSSAVTSANQTMVGVEVLLDSSGNSTSAPQSYLLKGAYSGSFQGEKWGVLLAGSTANKIDGYLTLPDTTASTSTTSGALIVGGGIGASGQVWAEGFNGPVKGNATSADKLKNAREINGVSFDGAKNIDIQWRAVSIPASSDLNAYQAEGVYRCDLDETAGGLLNCPTGSAFSMRVWNAAGVLQEVAEFSQAESRKIYQRVLIGDEWGEWSRVYTTIDAPTSVTGNAGTATKLAEARKINNTAFDGSQDITVADATKLPLTGGTMSGQIISTMDDAIRVVKGNYGLIMRSDGSNFYMLTTASGNQYGTWNNLRPMSFNLSSGDLTAGHNFTAGGNVTAFSDRRLKKNIKRIKNALSKVGEMGGYTFTRKDIGIEQAGLIAQEVKKVLPEAVMEQSDKRKTLSVSYGSVTGLLVEAIKELTGQVKALTARVTVLEGK